MLGWIVQNTELDTESLPGRPIVEIYSDCRVLIEMHKGIMEYTPAKIAVKVRYGTVAICGSHLQVSKLTAQRLVITGRIDGIYLSRGKCG